MLYYNVWNCLSYEQDHNDIQTNSKEYTKAQKNDKATINNPHPRVFYSKH